jgi:hypothetical protein
MRRDVASVRDMGDPSYVGDAGDVRDVGDVGGTSSPFHM